MIQHQIQTIHNKSGSSSLFSPPPVSLAPLEKHNMEGLCIFLNFFFLPPPPCFSFEPQSTLKCSACLLNIHQMLVCQLLIAIDALKTTFSFYSPVDQRNVCKLKWMWAWLLLVQYFCDGVAWCYGEVMEWAEFGFECTFYTRCMFPPSKENNLLVIIIFLRGGISWQSNF